MRPIIGLMLAALLMSCATGTARISGVSDIAVTGVRSTEKSCKPSDVAIDSGRAAAYFRRAQLVDFRTIHDQYDWVECYAEGSLVEKGRTCSWKIQAGGVGIVDCAGETRYVACRHCDDLLLSRP